MFTNAGTNIEIAYAHLPDHLGGIVWQTVDLHIIGYMVSVHKLKRNRQVLFYQLIHGSLDFLFIFPIGLTIQDITNLAFLSLNMCVSGLPAKILTMKDGMALVDAHGAKREDVQPCEQGETLPCYARLR